MTAWESSPTAPRVVILSTSEGIWGGSQIFNGGLCNYLAAHELDAVLATPRADLYSCPTTTIGSIAGRLDRFLVALSLAKEMKKTGAQAVILDDLSGLWLAPVFRLFGLRVFAILHLQLKKKDKWGHGHSRLSFQLLRISSLFVHHLFSVGKANVDVFPKAVEFIGNYVPDSFFVETLDKRKIYDLGAVTRLASQKNLGLLLHLVANLNKVSLRPISCAVVGEGPEKDSLTELATQLNLSECVTFLPWATRESVPSVLDQMRCFAITSRHEGFATTLLESHARGVPAIVTETSGFCPEFVTGYGHPTGIVFAETDVDSEAFLSSVLSLIDSYRSYENHCISKASEFSQSNVLGRIERRLKEHLD